MPSKPALEVTLAKLIHGGQAIGTLSGGKKALVWGGLPGEKVLFQPTKSRRDYVEGVVTEVLLASKDRIEPRDQAYLSTSPWQIMPYKSENEYKKELLKDAINHAGIDFEKDIAFHAPKKEWNYRNKMEYSFFGDDEGLHLALFSRGTHSKQIVSGSSLARPEIGIVANRICKVLHEHDVRASDLKSVVIRCDEAGKCVSAVYTRSEAFPNIPELSDICKGIVVCYSNPKSPASVRTRDLYKFGDITLKDKLLKTEIGYDVFSFFQGNLEMFRAALEQIKDTRAGEPILDMYSGVGAIGLSLSGTEMLVESDANNVVWAKKNTGRERSAEVIHANSERALEYIDSGRVLIVDPPRAGLHRDLVDRIIDVKPPRLIYLSCNPSTQARDLELLSSAYDIESIVGYNFFPRTPHIESLVILIKK